MEKIKKRVGRPKKVITIDDFFSKSFKNKNTLKIILPNEKSYDLMTEKEKEVFNYAYLMAVIPYFYSLDDEEAQIKMSLSMLYSAREMIQFTSALSGSELDWCKRGYLEGLLNHSKFEFSDASDLDSLIPF